jgi:hypothetical protein
VLTAVTVITMLTVDCVTAFTVITVLTVDCVTAVTVITVLAVDCVTAVTVIAVPTVDYGYCCYCDNYVYCLLPLLCLRLCPSHVVSS